MISVLLAFVAIAAIIFIGFFANMLLKRVGIPEIFFLVLVGVLLGPISGLFPSSIADTLIPYFSQFTLAMILFNVGLELDLNSLVREGPRTAARTIVYVLLSIALITLIFNRLLGWPLYQSFLLGSILGGETTMTVVPYVARELSSRKVYASLSVESALNSAILIIIFSALLSSYQASIPLELSTASTIVSGFFAELSIGVVIGVIAAVLWVKAMRILSGADYLYIATIGFMLAIYALVDAIGGSGVIAVLTLAFTMSNIRLVADPLSIYLSVPAELKQYIMNFQDEITFFLRTFFYVFLGLVLEIRSFLSPQIYMFSLIIMGILVLSRFIATWSANAPERTDDKLFIFSMMAQGLTPAVLATTLLEYDIPMSHEMVMIATLVIIMTNLVTIVGARRQASRPIRPPSASPQPGGAGTQPSP
ncbi:MAG: cation:proton antiporter [Conexivisphaera sp.]|jgi:cell volume regulation protein A